MLDYLIGLWTTNPVRVVSVLTAAVVAMAAKAGLILDEASVSELVAVVVPILLGGEAARSRVTPWQGDVGPNSDDLLPTVPEA